MCKTPERLHQYDIAYMKMALAVAELSYAQKKKVGSIIVSPEGQVISQGFNGMPTGFDNCCEEIMPDGKLVTKVECLHSETNAITKCAKYMSSTKDATLYVTLSPCIHCAKLIVQAEIKRVVYLNNYKDLSGLDLLRNCGIIVEQLDINNSSENHNEEYPDVTILGSGIYSGLMSGHIFTYNGQKYKCSDGVRGINCKVTVVVGNNIDQTFLM